MNIRKISLIASAVLIASIATAVTLDAVKIAWKPKTGSSIKYHVTANAKLESPQGTAEMQYGADTVHKILEVKADGSVVVEESQSNVTIKFGDQDFSSMAPQSSKVTSTISPVGETLERKSDQDGDQPRMSAAMEFLYPDKEMNVNDSWTIKKPKDDKKGVFSREMTFTYLGTEKIGKWDCYKVKTEYKETDAPTNVSSSGTIWLAVEDGEVVKGSYKLKSIELAPQMPPTDATTEMMRVEN